MNIDVNDYNLLRHEIARPLVTHLNDKLDLSVFFHEKHTSDFVGVNI